jgi:hypothetical protein
MRVLAEACATPHDVVVQYAQHAKVYPARVIVAREAKGVVSVQPAVVGVASCVCCMKNCFAHKLSFLLNVCTYIYIKDSAFSPD